MPFDFVNLQQKINTSDHILVIYGAQANFSTVAVATSFYLLLKNLGKKVALVSPAPPVVDLSHLVGINKVKDRLTGENLVIKLPLPASEIDKVVSDLDQEHDSLSLIVKPKKPHQLLQLSSLPLAYQAPDYDLIAFFDVRTEDELVGLGEVTPDFYVRAEHNFTLSDFANPSPFPADLQLVLGKDDTPAAVWAAWLRATGISIDADQASNLLMALERDSDGFAGAKSTADTFELAAWLLRQGGTRYTPDEQAARDFHPEHHLPQLIQFRSPPAPATPAKKDN